MASTSGWPSVILPEGAFVHCCGSILQDREPRASGRAHEITCEAVIPHGALKCGNIKERDQVAVIRRVFEFPILVTQQAHFGAALG